MQIDVHHVESHVARTAYAEHRVEVGSVVIHQSATFVYELLYFRYFALEETERVGIGHHHGSYGVIEQSAQVFRVDDSVGCRFYLNNFQSAYSSRSRVCAVSPRLWW